MVIGSETHTITTKTERWEYKNETMFMTVTRDESGIEIFTDNVDIILLLEDSLQTTFQPPPFFEQNTPHTLPSQRTRAAIWWINVKIQQQWRPLVDNPAFPHPCATVIGSTRTQRHDLYHRTHHKTSTVTQLQGETTQT